MVLIPIEVAVYALLVLLLLKLTGANALNTIKKDTCFNISLSSLSNLEINCENSLSELMGFPCGKAKLNLIEGLDNLFLNAAITNTLPL